MSNDFEKYVKALPLKEDVRYLMVVDRNAVSADTLNRLNLPNVYIIRVHGSCDAIRLFELQPKPPVADVKEGL